MSRKAGKFEWNMVELPDGITTSNGNWYHTTTDNIEKYISGLLNRHSIEKIIKSADHWVSCPNGFSFILYLILILVGVNPFLSAGISLFIFFGFYFNTSAFVATWLNPVARLFDFDGFLYVAAASALIYVSMQGQQTAMWLGLLLFFLFKVGLLKMLLKWVQSKKLKPKASREDRILNMLLIRYGMKEGLYSGNIKQMQDSLLNTVNYHKTRKKKK
jgi:hypothetical protein